MKTTKFRFLLWQRNSDGTWMLRTRSTKRTRVERLLRKIPRNVAWRFVDLRGGLLAQSLARA